MDEKYNYHSMRCNKQPLTPNVKAVGREPPVLNISIPRLENRGLTLMALG